MNAALKNCLDRLRADGLLLKQDKALPSVATLIAGGPIAGSWWGHPKGSEIFNTLDALADHSEALLTKLVSGKDTFVHRSLWPDLLAAVAGPAPEPPSAPARRLLARIARAGSIRVDRMPTAGKEGRKALLDSARELELRLLVHSEELHTETGAHAKRLETWSSWAKRARVEPAPGGAASARARLTGILAGLNARHEARGTLPWTV